MERIPESYREVITDIAAIDGWSSLEASVSITRGEADTMSSEQVRERLLTQTATSMAEFGSLPDVIASRLMRIQNVTSDEEVSVEETHTRKYTRYFELRKGVLSKGLAVGTEAYRAARQKEQFELGVLLDDILAFEEPIQEAIAKERLQHNSPYSSQNHTFQTSDDVRAMVDLYAGRK